MEGRGTQCTLLRPGPLPHPLPAPPATRCAGLLPCIPVCMLLTRACDQVEPTASTVHAALLHSAVQITAVAYLGMAASVPVPVSRALPAVPLTRALPAVPLSSAPALPASHRPRLPAPGDCTVLRLAAVPSVQRGLAQHSGEEAAAGGTPGAQHEDGGSAVPAGVGQVVLDQACMHVMAPRQPAAGPAAQMPHRGATCCTACPAGHLLPQQQLDTRSTACACCRWRGGWWPPPVCWPAS